MKFRFAQKRPDLSSPARHSSLVRQRTNPPWWTTRHWLRSFTLPQQRARGAFTLPELRGRHAFTLIELLVVIGLISVLLVAVIPVVNSLSKSGGRKAAISNLLGAIEQAHVQAIKDGQATYVVFPTFTSGTQATLDRYHHKSYAIFEDDPAAPATPKQLTNWKILPTGVAFRSAGAAKLSNLTDPTTLSPSLTLAFTPELAATPVFRCVKFNANGEIESPASPPSEVSLAVFEGYMNGTTEVITGSKGGSGDPLAVESINIARLTGRAVSAP